MVKKISVFVVICAFIISAAALVAVSAEKKKNDDLYQQVELFTDVLSIIESDYVEEATPKKLIYGSLKGMISSLDPHSQFMDPDTYDELKVDTEGKFGGIGIEITIKDDLLTVVTPLENTPAWKAGIKPNDRIVKINNDLTRNITLTEAVKKLRGNPSTVVNITVLRESEKKILEFKLTRDIIKVKDITDTRILEDGIGYIKLIEFKEITPRDMDAAIEKLQKQGMNALIIDLRNNPGGLLTAAIDVTERFIEKGRLILYTKGRKESQNEKFISRNKKPILDMPLAILINEGSASGSEIVAACLQDYKRAIILGTKSFGKASVQSIIPLSDGSALRLTTSKYYTPSGKVIHETGVTPDIEVPEGKIETAVKEKVDTENAEEIFDKLEKKDAAEEKPDVKETDYKKDNQLMRAVDVIKAIRIFKDTPKQNEKKEKL